MARKNELPQVPAAQQFMFWLSEAAYDMRLQNHASRELVAGFAGVSTNTIKRFENEGAGTNNTIAHLIAGYARACELDDGRELYRRAIERWAAECPRPLTTESVQPDPGPDAWLTRAARRGARALQGDSQ